MRWICLTCKIKKRIAAAAKAAAAMTAERMNPFPTNEIVGVLQFAARPFFIPQTKADS